MKQFLVDFELIFFFNYIFTIFKQVSFRFSKVLDNNYNIILYQVL